MDHSIPRKAGVPLLLAMLAVVLTVCLLSAPAQAVDCFDEESLFTVYVDGVDVTPIDSEMIDDMIFSSVKSFAVVMGAESVSCEEGSVTVEYEDRTIVFTEGSRLVYVNGTQIYRGEAACTSVYNTLMAPLDVLCRSFNADMQIDPETEYVLITSHADIPDDLDVEEIDLFARLVWAESGNQPLEGKIGVANVVLNRIKSDLFPTRITDIIYDNECGVQFSPAYNGGLNNTPTEDCFTAVYAALEGENTVGEALFFAAVYDCWMSANRTMITQIEDHYFWA